jgi:hypothetical protein
MVNDLDYIISTVTLFRTYNSSAVQSQSNQNRKISGNTNIIIQTKRVTLKLLQTFVRFD